MCYSYDEVDDNKQILEEAKIRAIAETESLKIAIGKNGMPLNLVVEAFILGYEYRKKETSTILSEFIDRLLNL